MKRKQIHVLIFGLTLFVLMSGFPASAQELTKEAKIEKILSLTKADAIVDQMFAQAKALQASRMPSSMTPEQRAKAEEFQGKIMDLVKSMTVKMRIQLAKIYSDNFTDEEINGMFAFYGSPAGRALMEKMPLILSQMTSAAQAMAKDMQPEIMRMIEKDFPTSTGTR